MSGGLRAALALGVAGALAAAAHVVAETPAEARDWRQSVPLGALVGAGLGRVVLAPRLRRGPARAALAGAVAAALGLVAFAALFTLAHSAIEALRGDPAEIRATFLRAAGAAFGVGGAAALALGAIGGGLAAAGRRGTA